MTGRAAKRLDERDRIFIKAFNIIPGLCNFTLSLAAMVKSDTAITVFQNSNLTVEQLAAPQQPMRKDQCFRTISMFLVIDAGSVDLQVWHVVSPLSRCAQLFNIWPSFHLITWL